MRRWCVIALLALLPLQWGSAFAAAYCGHAGMPATLLGGDHGHHGGHDASGSHPVSAIGMSVTLDTESADHHHPSPTVATVADDHGDCGTCHLLCLKGLAAASLGLEAPSTAEPGRTPYAGQLPEPLLAALFRPPLILRA
jgi:Protein of unknown function (DUF2946)